MSIDATRWAWKQAGIGSSRKLVLLAIADRADENHVAYPSISRLESDTDLDRKTVMKALSDLEETGLITAERSAGTVTRFRLVGVESRHEPVPKTVPVSGKKSTETSTKNGTGTSTKNGTGTSTKNGTGTSTKNGTGTKNGTSTNFPTNQYQKRDGEPPMGFNPLRGITQREMPPLPPKRGNREKTQSAFDRFWAAYPKKCSKGQAERAFAKINPDELLTAEIIGGVMRAKTLDPRFQTGEYTPLAATWLNAKGWMDEFDQDPVKPATSSAYAADPKPATSSAYGKRHGTRPKAADNSAAVVEAIERFNRRTGANDGAVIDGVCHAIE